MDVMGDLLTIIGVAAFVAAFLGLARGLDKV